MRQYAADQFQEYRTCLALTISRPIKALKLSNQISELG